ncbi:MAG: ABC transporter substrate-binding protein [Anaerolineaceae bacterium]|jgi:branched-chain amino acid transport system substrate-binding protein|nr:ABC transporter substrate-binding protein [Anaerolineaceae bacterium]
MRKSKLVSLMLVIIILAMSLTACGKKASDDVIKIGYVGALSGETAVWGQAGLNGMLLTAKEINEAGGILGKQVEVVGLDGRGDPTDSVNAFRRLATEENVIAVIGTNFSSCNIAMAPIADQLEVPLIATAASNPKVTVDEDGNLHPYSFRIGFIDPFQGQVLANLASAELDAKTAGIIYDIGSDYSTGLSQYFEEQFVANGGEVVAKVEGHSGDNDFRSQLSVIAEANPDVILVPWIYKDVALIANQARELGITAPLLGGDGWDSPELLSMAGEAIEGSFYTSQPSFANPVTKPYADAYMAEYNNLVPETEALFGHDGLYWIKDALERAGEATKPALREALENTTQFDGLMGSMSVDPKTHNPAKPASVYTFVDGERLWFGDYK